MRRHEQALATVNDLRVLLAPRVEAGAKLLDERRPGWAMRIDLDRLDMERSCNCVLGQEYEHDTGGDTEDGSAYSIGLDNLNLLPFREDSYGFDLYVPEINEHGLTLDEAYHLLDELWAEQVRARRTKTEAVGADG